MTDRFELTSADQHALIAWLAREFGGRRELGKTAVQKLTHILDEGFAVPTGYSFTLYTYGPFSRDLAGDLDVVQALQGIVVSYIAEENRYVVSVGETNHQITTRADKYLARFGSKLADLKTEFFDKKPRYLELFSTLLFILRRKPGISDVDLTQQLRAIKPKYDERETLSALGDLKDFLGKRRSQS